MIDEFTTIAQIYRTNMIFSWLICCSLTELSYKHHTNLLLIAPNILGKCILSEEFHLHYVHGNISKKIVL